MSYLITTDSSADLPQTFRARHGIPQIGMRFALNGEVYTNDDGLSMPYGDFYKALRNGANATTMQINSTEFVDFAEPLLAQGHDLLHISFSSGLSGTYHSIFTGAAELQNKYPEQTIAVVDSLCASMGQGLLVYYAARNRAAGMSLCDNVAWLRQNIPHICHWVIVDDLMFLYRGGRVSKSSAVIGSMIGIKPVLHMDNEGKLAVVGKVRGRKTAIKLLVQTMEKNVVGRPSDAMTFISHADCAADAEDLAAMLRRELGVVDILISDIGPVIGCHSGPGTLSLFFMGKGR